MLINDKVDAVFIPDSPSRIKATDYNQIKNEIQECITEAGLTPTKDVIQLPQALKILTAQSGAEEVAKIEAAGQEQVQAVNTAGQTQLNAINTAGAQAVQDAQTAANTAAAKATEAAGSATEAAGSASTATTQATNAAGSADLAHEWAVKMDGAVADGEYSAKYHAQQAAASASEANTAKTAAQSAKTAAQSAKTAAESAKTQAAASATSASQSAIDAANSAAAAKGLQIGTVFFSQSSLATDNPGGLPLWTGEYYVNASTLYPDFYAWVKIHPELCKTKAQYDEALSAYGECPYYVADEVAGSLRLPKLSNYIKAANTAEGITQKEAGLPDHTHKAPYGKNDSGAYHAQGYVAPHPAADEWFTQIIGYGKDSTAASASNSIYGKSNTVTPAHTTLYPWVYAYNAAVPASTAQAAEFIQTVSEMQTSKLDKAASNNFIGFVDTSAGISITLPYTATSNGWICCTWNGDNASSSGALAIDGVNVFYHLSSARDGRDSYWGSTALIPIRKGQIVTSTGIVPPNGNKLFFPFKNY